MKVLLIEGTSKLGGAQFDNILIQRSSQTIINYTTLCPEEGDLSKMLKDEGKKVEIIALPKLNSTSFLIREKPILNPFALINNFFYFIIYAFKLKNYFKKNKFDLIITNGMNPHFYGGLAAKFSKIPVVFRLMDVIRKEMLGGYGRRFFEKYAKFVNAKIVVPSNAVVNEMFSKEFIDKHTKVIYNATDLKDFNKASSKPVLREKYGFAEDEIVFGCYSRLTPWKGHRSFIEAAIKFLDSGSTAKFLIVGGSVFGNDDFMIDLKKMVLASKHSDKILFTGFRYDMGDCIQSANVVVVPSIHPDPCPRVMVEAMALGKAMIGSNIGGIPEVISDGFSGLIVEPGVVNELKKAFEFFIMNPNMVTEMGAKGYDRQMELFTLSNYQKQHEDYFISLI